jgi:hypothetical protein
VVAQLFFSFFQFCDVADVAIIIYDLARFGYKLNMKVLKKTRILLDIYIYIYIYIYNNYYLTMY